MQKDCPPLIFFWVLGFFNTEGSILLKKNKKTNCLVFDISQKTLFLETIHLSKILRILLQNQDFLFLLFQKTGLSIGECKKNH